MFFGNCRKYLIHLLYKYDRRAFSTHANEGQALNRWLKGWELVTPPVPVLPGADAPTALSWLRRRGPESLPDALLHRLFRREEIRLFDPAAARVSRVSKAKPLPPGSRLLIPRPVAAEIKAKAAAQQPGRRGKEELSPKEQQQRLAWIRSLRRRVLYQDADLIALDKPTGLAVQGGSGVSISLDEIIGPALGKLVTDPSDLRLVHRLDQQTSGVLVVATNANAAATLAQAFRSASASAVGERGSSRDGGSSSSSSNGSSGGGVEVRKTYWAIVAKQPTRDVAASGDQTKELPEQGIIDLPVGAREGGGGGARNGQAALTKFTLRQQDAQLALLELRPQTGRKHQLRIHCAQGLGAPILGDSKYGAVRGPVQRGVLQQLREEEAWEGNVPPMFLHCRSVLIKRPGVEAVRVVAPPPPHWQALLRLQRWGGTALAQDRASYRGPAKRQASVKRLRRE